MSRFAQGALEREADCLNEELLRAEHLLRERGYKVRAAVLLEDGYKLIFWDLEERWGLLLAGPRDVPTSVCRGPLHVRTQAAVALPKLVELLEVKSNDKHAEVAAATETLRAYLDGLANGTP